MPAKTTYSVSLWAGNEWEHVSTYGSFQEAKREWVMESDIVAVSLNRCTALAEADHGSLQTMTEGTSGRFTKKNIFN